MNGRTAKLLATYAMKTGRADKKRELKRKWNGLSQLDKREMRNRLEVTLSRMDLHGVEDANSAVEDYGTPSTTLEPDESEVES